MTTRHCWSADIGPTSVQYLSFNSLSKVTVVGPTTTSQRCFWVPADCNRSSLTSQLTLYNLSYDQQIFALQELLLGKSLVNT